jgi:hypothetical protein
MNKIKFILKYRATLKATYDWAKDQDKLDRFMTSVELTLYTSNATWNYDGEVVKSVWKSLGGKGKPTLKALRAMQ